MLTPGECDDCLISGDLHGHVANFEAPTSCRPDGAILRRHLVLQEVCHGGPVYPNGGCQSFGLLERIAQLKCEFPERVHFLLSNHELAELTDYPILKSKKLLNLMFRLGLEEAYGEATEQVREAYCEFLLDVPLGRAAGQRGLYLA